MSEKFRIAALMAVHNRWEMTQEILSKISVKDSPFNLCIHIVDDGSTDDTQKKLSCDSSLNYIRGEGDLYWARSMKKAQDSVTEPIDYFLWLNNDVSLTDDFFHRILASIKLFPKSILVGQTSDPVLNIITYSGLRRIGRHPHRLKTITAREKYESADTFCGNIVLIPCTINESLGGIDGTYEHGFADYDFGYRAKKMGFDIRVIPGILGTCALNPSQLQGLNRLESLKILSSRKYLPIRSQILFCKRHSGVTWPVYVISPYLKAFLKLKQFRSNQINAGF